MIILSVSNMPKILATIFSIAAATLGLVIKLLKINNVNKKNISKTIRKLLNDDIDVKKHKITYLFLHISSFIAMLLSYFLFAIFAIVTCTVKSYKTPLTTAFIGAGMFIFFFLYNNWLTNHSHMFKNDRFPVYRHYKRTFIILKIINKQVLIAKLRPSDMSNGKLLNINPRDNRYIRNISLLYKRHIYYINNSSKC